MEAAYEDSRAEAFTYFLNLEIRPLRKSSTLRSHRRIHYHEFCAAKQVHPPVTRPTLLRSPAYQDTHAVDHDTQLGIVFLTETFDWYTQNVRSARHQGSWYKGRRAQRESPPSWVEEPSKSPIQVQ
ncbi:hypothetical protein Cob_v001107 [Colletotrichum orbiculare MAFF 240422]|uniref:Uncharacterized protein n=1 Tax=Colletotrichum orbiculare (strain 104-T / ATCC 96160 / CBS 514.97 / LARS 414 / MAFF 240422) TaxID=1213857 RepID=A0A484G6Q1_COLOR|nr:hypothetical protein Cob_v001107 [Colletotrichum orbiculare MAFF 240422]